MKSSPLLWRAGLAPDFSASGKAKVAGLPQTCQVTVTLTQLLNDISSYIIYIVGILYFLVSRVS